MVQSWLGWQPGGLMLCCIGHVGAKTVWLYPCRGRGGNHLVEGTFVGAQPQAVL